jgi:hypothetical protein
MTNRKGFFSNANQFIFIRDEIPAATFSDCFDKSGEYRVIFQNEKFFVAGHDMLIPVRSYPDGVTHIEQLNQYQTQE